MLTGMGTLDSPWHLADGVRATVPHELASGHVVQLWRSGPEPHLHGWYEPAALLCHDLRAERGPTLDLDELRFVGRIDDAWVGSLFVYVHRSAGGEVLVDPHGIPHEPVDDPRRRSGHRFVALPPSAVHPRLHEPPTIRPVPVGPGLAAVLPFRPRPA